MSELIEKRIAECRELEDRLYAQMHQMVGMRLAFEEVIAMEEEPSGSSSAPLDGDTPD